MPEGAVESDEEDGLPEDQEDDDDDPPPACVPVSDVLRGPVEGLPE